MPIFHDPMKNLWKPRFQINFRFKNGSNFDDDNNDGSNNFDDDNDDDSNNFDDDNNNNDDTNNYYDDDNNSNNDIDC